jgi:hypothetical protein
MLKKKMPRALRTLSEQLSFSTGAMSQKKCSTRSPWQKEEEKIKQVSIKATKKPEQKTKAPKQKQTVGLMITE